MRTVRARMNGEKKRFAVIASRWNEIVTKQLLEGALDELSRHGVDEVDVIHAPGTWEIPPLVRRLVASDNPPDAVIALGCILQGQTAHAHLLGADVSTSLMAIQNESQVPVAWGILTPDTIDQALDRAGAKLGNKGREAALAAIEMAGLMEKL